MSVALCAAPWGIRSLLCMCGAIQVLWVPQFLSACTCYNSLYWSHIWTLWTLCDQFILIVSHIYFLDTRSLGSPRPQSVWEKSNVVEFGGMLPRSLSYTMTTIHTLFSQYTLTKPDTGSNEHVDWFLTVIEELVFDMFASSWRSKIIGWVGKYISWAWEWCFMFGWSTLYALSIPLWSCTELGQAPRCGLHVTFLPNIDFASFNPVASLDLDGWKLHFLPP